MNLLDYFRISRTLQFKEGKILIMDETVHVTPTSILTDLQKDLIDSLGFKQAYKIIYDAAKNISIEYNARFIKKRGLKSKRDIIEWQKKIMTLAGWGKWSIKSLVGEKNKVTAKIDYSPFPKVYGKTNFPVDIIATGLVAGGLQASFKVDIEAIETKCIAMGNQHCEIEAGPPKIIEKKKSELWKKWKLI